MTDTLISFETAKLAREKGFICNNGIIEIDQRMFPHLPDKIKRLSTQSLLQKWLRETYFIHIVIQVFHDTSGLGKKWTFSADIFYENGDVDRSGLTEDTYEEALEEGLSKALKLIP